MPSVLYVLDDLFSFPLGRIDQCMDRIAVLVSLYVTPRLGATSFTLSDRDLHSLHPVSIL